VKLDWTPPEGMGISLAEEWRRFYRAAMRNYGITPAEYRALYIAQLGRCFICQVARGKHPDDPKGGGGRRLGIDHNHLIGNCREAVRGLLCTGSLSANTCNRMIGHYTLPALKRAVIHLEESPAQAVFAALGEGMSDTKIQGMVLHP
jgi:hypothetical protein